MKLDHILLTTDQSPESIRPYQSIADLARSTGAKITLLTVVEEYVAVPHGAPLAPPVTPPDAEKDLAHARMALEDQSKALGEGLTVEIAAIMGTSVAKEIVHYAQTHDVDLIALSTHGRTGLRRLALGSVAEAVLRHAGMPVLCFPQPE